MWQLSWKELYYELNHHVSAVDQRTVAHAVVANNLEGKNSSASLVAGLHFSSKIAAVMQQNHSLRKTHKKTKH